MELVVVYRDGLVAVLVKVELGGPVDVDARDRAFKIRFQRLPPLSIQLPPITLMRMPSRCHSQQWGIVS